MNLRIPVRHCLTLAVVLALVSNVANAQTPQRRIALLEQGAAAVEAFEVERAANLFLAAIDPEMGQLDSSWRDGVRQTVEVLVNMGRDSAAVAVLRWAIRLDRRFQVPDESVAGALFTAARAFVTETRDQDSSVVRATWDWPSDSINFSEPGVLAVEPVPDVDNARVLVVGRGLLLPSTPNNLPARSYQVEVTADGYRPIRVWREVLPNVTTSLAFRPRLETVAVQRQPAAPRPAATPEQLGVTQSRGGGFPTSIAVLGALGAGAAAYFLLKGGGDPHGATPGEPGGIIVSLPKR